MQGSQTPESVLRWCDADSRMDLKTMEEQLAPDAILISPLTNAFEFHGPREIIAVYAAAFDLFSEVEITIISGADRDWFLHGSQDIQGHPMNEIQWLHLNEEGLIDRITLFIRPVPAMLATLGSIAPGLHRRQVVPRSAVIASTPVRVLAWMMGVIERFVMPRIGPTR